VRFASASTAAIPERRPAPHGAPSGRIDRTYLIYRSGAALLRALPRPAAQRAGAIGGAMAARRDTSTMGVVTDNLRRVRRDLGAEELAVLSRRAFVEYGRYWAATARVRASDARRLSRLVVVEGRENFDLHRSGAVIYALPHLGAWEVGGFWAVQQGLDLTTVVEPAASTRLSEFFTSQRRALGMHIIELGDRTATELLKVLGEGRGVALVCDRDLLGDGIEVELFGDVTRLPGGPALLSLRSGAPIVPTGTYLQQDGKVRVVFGPPIHPPRTGRLRENLHLLTQEIASRFEELIAKDPAQWHVFQPNWPSSPGGPAVVAEGAGSGEAASDPDVEGGATR
jgi:phosphatidylinositol dimannoside acyltransferase